MKRMLSFIFLLMLSAFLLSACSLSTLSNSIDSNASDAIAPSSNDTTNISNNDNGSNLDSSAADSGLQKSGDGTQAVAKQPSSAINVKSSSVEYKVQKGDTFYRICKKFYTNSNKYNLLITQNNIKDTSHIIAGDTLIIPEPDKQ
jgi:nucleoid-associated protein YgaU